MDSIQKKAMATLKSRYEKIEFSVVYIHLFCNTQVLLPTLYVETV